ncbi:multidrug effflux MFS transporter [Bosea sp. BK604]|uniref:multidrug effflux MFS transporter n=1 Tax=Bosea sp. BK604 TaxID=2512180 RepID=UPI00104FF285|nr:multidrug effflux MFS transporter [Bosea sp. BK604]TCR64811.1 DHA1 family bicyclomycin/chloramphenicol resistance-like MFS transporter [Bosea sp. BK604]
MTAKAAAARPTLLVLVAISTLQPIALNLLAPATPALARAFGASYATIQLTLTLFLVAVALTQLIIGPLSDRFGRRPCVTLGIVVFVLGSLLGALSQSTAVLLTARVLEGAGSGIAFALARAIIRDTASKDQAASQIASVTMVMVVAPMISPYLGGHIETWFGWRAIFWTMTCFGTAVLLLATFKLPETAPSVGIRTSLFGIFRAFPALIGDRGFLVNVVSVTMTSGAFFAFVAAAPYIVVEVMGRGSDVYGAYFVLNALGYMLGNFFMSRRVVRYGTARMVRIGLIISFAAMSAGIAFSFSPWWTPLTLFVPLAFSALGNGLTIPGSTAAALSAKPELAGSAAGLMGAIQLGLSALATVIISRLVTLWPQALILMMWAMTGAGLYCLRFNRFKRGG